MQKDHNQLSLGISIILITMIVIVASIAWWGGLRGKQTPSSNIFKQPNSFVWSGENTETRSKPIFRIYGYYPYWKHIEFPAQKIPTDMFDGLSQAFIWPDGSGNIILPRGLTNASYIKPVVQSGKTFSISVGGWQHSAGFTKMASDPKVTEEFVKNLSNFVKTNGYNAVNIDWEYPEWQYSLALAELGKKIHKTIPEILLTASLPIMPSLHRMDIALIHPAFDQLHVMAYDIESGWGWYGGYNAPLFANRDMPRDLSIDTLIKTEYLNRGVPKEKIVLWLPLYGRKFEIPAPYQSVNDSKTIEYKDIPFQSCKTPIRSESWPLLKCLGFYISYDDAESLRQKIQFAKTSGFAGVFFWALGQDDNKLLGELWIK